MSRRVLLFLAFFLIIGGGYGLLTKEDKQPKETAQVELIEFSAWRASRSLQQGEPVTAADLRPVTLSQQQAEQLGLTSQERFSLINDSLAAQPIAAGSIVSEQDIAGPDHPEYVELLLAPGMVAYPVTFAGNTGYPLVLSPGDFVDVVMISSLSQNMAENDTVNKFQGLSVAPLLRARKVLKVGENMVEEGQPAIAETTLVLELSREEVSQMMLAKRVGLLDFHKSIEEPLPQVRAGDVLPDFSSVTELRGVKKVVN